MSLEEKIVGKDYDGETIYERTFVGRNISLTANSANSINLIASGEADVPREIISASGNVAGVMYAGGPVVQYGLGAVRIAGGDVTWASNVLFSTSGSLQLSIFSQQATTQAYYRVTVRYKR